MMKKYVVTLFMALLFIGCVSATSEAYDDFELSGMGYLC